MTAAAKQTAAKSTAAKEASDTPTPPADEQATGNQTGGNGQGNDTPVSLAESGNADKVPPATIGGKEFDLPADTAAALKAQASHATSTDSQGIDRVIDRYVDDWRPAQVEPDPDEVARLEAATEAMEAHREERRELLGLRAEESRTDAAKAEDNESAKTEPASA